MGTTVDFGIDLGTTNSAISRMTTKGAIPISVRNRNYIPSVVAIDKRGDLKIGEDALNVHLQNARWFKRLMGTSNVLPLADGSEWTPERLSAEVLKALRAAAKLKTNEDVVDVVITVPAMFTQPQCAATHEAARMAGLNAVVLLQEPIAAATAYLSDNPVDGYYLVYDLGGGTFDVSLVRLQHGEMNVIEHGGDNYLGGADFDRAIFDWTLAQIERRCGDTTQFSDGASRYQLLAACEDARIALSVSESASIYLDEFDLPIAKLELTRDKIEALLDSFISRTIDIARERLRVVPTGAAGVRSVLLVGGPTQMPYVRSRIESDLGIPLDLDQDPMTVVAKGAAIHAGTILKGVADRQSRSTLGTAQIDLRYEPVSPEAYVPVAGRVVEPAAFLGEVLISSASGDWETGWTMLVNSAFSTEVTLRHQQTSEFKIALRDLSGRVIDCAPSSFVIRSGVRAAQPVTPYNYGVVLEDGSTSPIVPAGKPLPATGSCKYRLGKGLRAGSPGVIPIYFTEGNSPYAGDNSQVGELEIRGVDLSRSLNENEDVEIRIRIDESRLLKASVYIPIIDLDRVIEMRSRLDTPDLDDLEKSVTEARIAIADVEDCVSSEEQDTIMRAGRLLEVIEATLVRVANGEVGEADRIHKQLADVKASMRPLTDKYELQAKYIGLVSYIAESEALCEQFNDQMGIAKLTDLRQDADKALLLESDKGIDTTFDRVRDIFWQHYGKTRECWEYQVQVLKQKADFATDSRSYYELLHGAERALAANDYEGVRLNCLRASDILPSAEKLKNRYHDATLRLVQP